MANDKIAYYAASKLIWQWRLHGGVDGCRIVPHLALSMDLAPPPLPKKPEPKTALPKAVSSTPKLDPLDKMVDDIARMADAFSRFKTWLNTPEPPKAPEPAPVEKRREPYRRSISRKFPVPCANC